MLEPLVAKFLLPKLPELQQFLEGKDSIEMRLEQRRYGIRTGSAAYFCIIGFLVIFLCVVAPLVATRTRQVKLVFFQRTSYVGLTSRHCYKMRRLHKTAFLTFSALPGG